MFATLPQPPVISACARRAPASREFPRKHRRWRIAELAARVFAQSGVPVLAAHSAVTRHSVCVPVRQRSCYCATREQRRVKVENLSFSIFSVCLSLSVRPHTNPQRHDTHETSRPFCLAASQDPRGAEKLTGTHGQARWATPCAFLNSCANKLE